MTKDEFRKNMAEAFANVLEEKGLSWKKEWAGIGGSCPQNAITKANYKGINAFWLSLVAMMKGYTDARWATMVQIMDKDGKYHPKEKWHLKAGSKAAHVEYWMPFDLKEKKALTWDVLRQELADGRSETEFRLSARYTPVFNACDVEGMPEIAIDTHSDITMDSLVVTLSDKMDVPILLDGGDRAYYSPAQDRIHLPTLQSFESDYAFNSTALHELAHSTGHPRRLNRARDGIGTMGTYAYEELVAEMCSCFMGYGLAARPSEEHIQNHKAYVQSWVNTIRQKPDALVYAIKDAKTAANYMDWKAGLMTDMEYIKACRSVVEVHSPQLDRDRPELEMER